MRLSTIIIVLSFVALNLFSAYDAWAQESKSVVQFSGVVTGEDTLGIPGVHIYVPVAGRGTTTNQYGYFSMPALVGDSVIISAIGHHRQYYIIPGDRGESVTIGIRLEEDTTMLPLVEIFPYGCCETCPWTEAPTTDTLWISSFSKCIIASLTPGITIRSSILSIGPSSLNRSKMAT